MVASLILETATTESVVRATRLPGIYNASITFNTGDGNDTIEGVGGYYGIHNQGLINTGNGKDTIIAQGGNLSGGAYGCGLYNIFTIDTGDGDDIITADAGIDNRGTIDTGDGDDIITGISTLYYGYPIIAGSGDFSNAGTIDTGNGNDSIITDRTLIIGTYGTINTGNGMDIITSINAIENNGTIKTGNGADFIIANGGFSGMGSVFLENGKDYLNGFGTGNFNGGNNEDTLELTSGSYTVGISGTTVSFTSSGVIMITSEFEKLIAGSTTYDFTTLSQGQTIVVP